MDSLIQELRQHIESKLPVQQELGVLLRRALFLSHVCTVFLRELLGVVNAGLVVDS